MFSRSKVLSRIYFEKEETERGGGWISQAFLTPIMSNVQNLNSLRKNMGLGVSKYEFESRLLFRSKLVS